MSEMPAPPPPNSMAERSGPQNVWRGVSRSGTSAPAAQPSLCAAPCTAIDPPPWRPSALSEQCVGDDHALDLAGPLVDLGDARVAEVTLHVELLRVAHPAVDLDGLVGHAVGRLRGEQLGHARFARVALPAVLEAGGAQGEQP